MGAIDLNVGDAYRQASIEARFFTILFATTTIALLVCTLLGGLNVYATTNANV